MNLLSSSLPDGERWSVFDTLSWITFGELRKADWSFELPKSEWSYDWKRWPPGWLSYAFEEMAIGILWTPDPDDIGPFELDKLRAWARCIMADTGKDADTLRSALQADTQRYHANQDAWRRAKQDLNMGMRRGYMRVWGAKAFAPSRPDPNSKHELLDPLLFTETRGVTEHGWIDWTSDSLGFVDYRGPSYDQVFFDSAEIQALWPTKISVQPSTLEWMTATAEKFLAETGGKPKRDPMVKDCRAALSCPTREAEAAYKQLPDHLRRRRGERD